MFSVGCGNPGEQQDTWEVGNIKLWAAPSYVKIYQDIDYSQQNEYSAFYNSNKLALSMFIGEKEGGSLILTPDYDVHEYTVSVSDLVSSDNNKIEKENIAIYNQKYVDVVFASASHTNSKLGMCPDAILPFAKAVEYKENVIAKSNNQGIYFDVDSKAALAGQYNGTITVNADGQTYNFGISVNVFDAHVSEETHLKSSFLLRTQELLSNEKDGTDEMYAAYYEQFLDYRVNITKFTQSFDEQTYINGLRKYYNNPLVSTVHFPRVEDSSRTNYDFNSAEYWFNKIAELAFEDNVNYFEKMHYYLAIIDEPHINTKIESKVVPIFRNFAIVRHSVIKDLQANRASYDVSDELFNAVIDGIENFEFILTEYYREEFTFDYVDENGEHPNWTNPQAVVANEDERYEITWCPLMTEYDTLGSSAKYDSENVDQWWYGCNYPPNPYPTYHLDDAILTARVFSWMSYEYDVKGNLYWRVNYGKETNSFEMSEDLENPYDITNFMQKTNGEGLLVYPGKPYGIYGFVPSLRLISIRDGMEDYEVLRAAGDGSKEIAKNAGYDNFDLSITFSKLYQSLYQGTKVVGDFNDFEMARELLANLSVFAAKGTIIADVKNTPTSTLVKVFVSDGVLKIDGVEASYVEKANGKEYSVEVVQTEKSNYLNFTLEQGTETSEFNMFVGGKKEGIDISAITFSGNEIVNDASVIKNSNGVSVTLYPLKDKADGSEWSDKSQIIQLTGSEISSNLKKSKGISEIILEIENPGEAFDLVVKYTAARGNGTIFNLSENNVAANSTSILTIDMGSYKWEYGAIEQLMFFCKYADAKQERTFTIKSITLTL